MTAKKLAKVANLRATDTVRMPTLTEQVLGHEIDPLTLIKNPELNEGERYSRNGRFVISKAMDLPPLLFKSSRAWPWREIKVGEGLFVPDAKKVSGISYWAKELRAEFKSRAGERRGVNGIWVKRLK